MTGQLVHLHLHLPSQSPTVQNTGSAWEVTDSCLRPGLGMPHNLMNACTYPTLTTYALHHITSHTAHTQTRHMVHRPYAT